jgi:hypothetical protein
MRGSPHERREPAASEQEQEQELVEEPEQSREREHGQEQEEEEEEEDRWEGAEEATSALKDDNGPIQRAASLPLEVSPPRSPVSGMRRPNSIPKPWFKEKIVQPEWQF